MFAHALPQGSLRPAEVLPPTLTPNAVLAMAPPAPRRVGFLGACVVYSSCALALTFAPSLSTRGLAGPKTSAGPFVVPAEPPHINVQLNPERPPAPKDFAVQTSPMAPKRDEGWTPPNPTNAVPDQTPATLPTEDQFSTSLKQGDITSTVRNKATTTSDGGGDSTGADSTKVMEITFSQIRVLQQVTPNYPPLPRLAKIQGDVVLLMTVDPRGVPAEVRALSGPHPSLEQEAMRVARLWRFEPASMNGQPVSAQFRLTIQFRLK